MRLWRETWNGLPAALVCCLVLWGCGGSKGQEDSSKTKGEKAQAGETSSSRVRPVKSVRVNRNYLAAYEVATGSFTLYHLPGFHHPDMDGTQVAYLGEENRLYVFDLASGKNHLLNTPELPREWSPTLSISDGLVAMDDRGRKAHGDYRVLSTDGSFDKTFNCGDEPKGRLPYDELIRCSLAGDFLCAPTTGRKEMCCWNIRTGEKRRVPEIEGSTGYFFTCGSAAGRFVIHNYPVLTLYDPAARTHVPVLRTEKRANFLRAGVDDGKLVWAVFEKDDPARGDTVSLNVMDVEDPQAVKSFDAGLPANKIDDIAASGNSLVAINDDERVLHVWDGDTGARKEVSIDQLSASYEVGGFHEGRPMLFIQRENLSRTLLGGSRHVVWVQHWKVYITVPAGGN